MDGCTPIALQGATYNSGVVLFGLADLYYATGNESLLDIGRSIAYAAMASYTIPGIGILQESCEHNTDTSNGPPGCLPDEISVSFRFFRSVFVLLGYLHLSMSPLLIGPFADRCDVTMIVQGQSSARIGRVLPRSA